MSLLICYATETGNAEDVGEMLWREARRRGCKSPRMASFEQLSLESLASERTVVFLIATSGQGEFPTSARSLWTCFRQKILPNDYMDKMHFSVVALGDSSYQKYNRAGRLLRARLVQLGAHQLCPPAYCDDQHEIGIDGAFQPWKHVFFEALKGVEGFERILDSKDPELSERPFVSKFRLRFCDGEHIDEPSGSAEYVRVETISNERQTSIDHFQDTRLITFNIGNHEEALRYRSGDVLMIQPENLDESIKIAVEALKLSDETLDRPFKLEPTDSNIRLPPGWLIGTTTSLRYCLKRVLDLQHIPKKSFFEILSRISKDEDEAERLAEFCQPENLDLFLDYTLKTRRTAAEAFRDFYRTASQLSHEQLFDVLPLIRPRAFSIASSPMAHPGVIQLLVAKVEYKPPIAKMADLRRGLCSCHLTRLRHGDMVFVRIRDGTFHFPSPETPIICIGPGTGVAPFRSVINDRLRIHPDSESLLFFGCRGRFSDYYFEIEWTHLEKPRIFVAFSRDQEHKIYVQHLLKKEAALIWRLLQQGAYIFVAGSAGEMPNGVCEMLGEIGKEIGGEENLVKTLETQGRLQFETWS
ncbi:unnamed protein product, partial [Mesorhabditis belari]|uniref:NADPH-dependent diflavin oxidoreductase 1 n=1 Tax=Mesorhabditis belari TaxID=2138241 RepID=A0AAF3J741_9BILA